MKALAVIVDVLAAMGSVGLGLALWARLLGDEQAVVMLVKVGVSLIVGCVMVGLLLVTIDSTLAWLVERRVRKCMGEHFPPERRK